MTNGSSQLEAWRSQAAKLLENLIPQIRSATFTAEDKLVDDLLRTLSNQSPRPTERDPYTGLFSNAPVAELRRRAASGVKVYLDSINTTTIVAADDQADRLIRQLRGLSTSRPTGIYPYEGIFGYTEAKVSQEQIQLWRQQAAVQLQKLVADIPSPEPTPADELADALLRGLGGQSARPAGRLPYEGLFFLPRSLPFPQVRQRGADALKVFIEHVDDAQLGSKDAVIDNVIRKITNLRGLQNVGDRPVNRLPYEGLFSEQENVVRLSKDFTLQELTRSTTASLRGIDNTPTPTALAHLRTLVQQILQPAQDALGQLNISSGYRSPALNQAVGGVSDSDHTTGYAVDVIPADGDTLRFAKWVVRNVPFDQVILEYGTLQRPDWVHVSASPRNRRQVLRQDKSGTRPISI